MAYIISSIYLPFFFFALGAIIASFIGVIVVRFGTGEKWWCGHSLCDSCASQLTVRDLIPILSWVSTIGHCRHCGSRISILSSVTETLLGILFVLTYFTLGISFSFFVFLIALSLLTAIVLYDLRHTIIPSIFNAFFVIISLSFAVLSAQTAHIFWTTFMTSVAIGLFIVAIHYVSRGKAMGLADAPVAFGLSLLAGSFAFSGFVYSFWIGAIIGIIILLRTSKGHRIGIEVPFAPFLAAGFLLAFFTGLNISSFILWLMNL